ncbi:MAG TPA: AAA family ATPase [Verrucomicrobiae bacterium]|nr:AAA family ATPase [Verrucomicrobiae bacterium]
MSEENKNDKVAVLGHPGIAAMAGRGVKIPGDQVNKATEDLPDNQRSAIRRWHAHYFEHDLSLAEAGKLIGYSDAVAGLVMRGKYDGDLTNIVTKLEKFFELEERRSQGRRLEFIPTSLTREIWQVCDAAREFQKIAFIFGDQQIGKTEALKAYQIQHNHGSTIYVRNPAGGMELNFLMELARKLRISENLTVMKLRQRIISAFDDRMLLIVDEGHQSIPESGQTLNRIKTIEFIREIFDQTACGVVICATNVFRDAMEVGVVEKILRQTKRRRLCAKQLPNIPPQADLNTFAAAHGLPPATGAAAALEKRMVEDEALGMWLTLLRMGAKVATQRKQEMSWAHVIAADAGLKKMEGKKF